MIFCPGSGLQQDASFMAGFLAPSMAMSPSSTSCFCSWTKVVRDAKGLPFVLSECLILLRALAVFTRLSQAEPGCWVFEVTTSMISPL